MTAKTVVMVNQRHVCGNGCGCGANSKKETKPAGSLTEQVKAELKKHPGMIAAVDEERRVVREYMMPRPYFERTANTLTPAERADLEKERDRLIDELPRLGWAARTRVQGRLDEVEGLLRSDRLDADVERRHQERGGERRREQGSS
jgi:hypothetical protein